MTLQALDLIEELGSVVGRLILHQIVFDDPSIQTSGDANEPYDKLAAVLYQRIVEHLGLLDAAFIGLGASKESKDVLSRRLGRQFLGAVQLCDSYSSAVSLARSCLQIEVNPPDSVASYKTILQEYSQGRQWGQPAYSLVADVGPDHAKAFRMQVRTKDGKTADGEGSSKRRAQEAAAREYLERFVGGFASKRVSRLQKAVRPQQSHLVPELHRTEVEELGRNLGIPHDSIWLLSQALVHTSFLNEAPLGRCRDNRMLARLGAAALDLIMTYSLVNRLLTSSSPESREVFPRRIASAFCQESVVAQGFALLRLDGALLAAVGQSRMGLSDQIRSNAFQAVLAVMFLVYQEIDSVLSALPHSTSNWLMASVDQLMADYDNTIDPKGRLQEQLQAIRIHWKYQAESSGPDHAAEHKASVTLSSPQILKRFTIRGGKGNSKRRAEARLASRVSRFIDEINSEIGVSTTSTILNTEAGRSLASFILEHELSVAPSSLVAARRWYKAGILGSRLLIDRGLAEFRLWAGEAELILRPDPKRVSNLNKALGFYRQLASLYGGRQYLCTDRFVALRRFVETLNPEQQQLDVRQTDAFAEILSLSKIARLLIKNRRMMSFSDIWEDFTLLHRGKAPAVQIRGLIPEIVLSEREGIYLTVLNEVVGLIDETGLPCDASIDLSVVHRSERNGLELSFEAPSHPKFMEAREAIHRSLLWEFLINDVPIISIDCEPPLMTVCCQLHSGTTLGLLSDLAVEEYSRETGLSAVQHEVVGRLLHDLKNQLVAYQVSKSAGSDRTSQLRSRYEASKHLDSALFLCRALEAIGHAMDVPSIECVDIGGFFRSYIAQKMLEVPSNIRIAPPHTLERCDVWTSPVFLGSILENLIKNSVEAMPGGGEIQVDWVFDPAQYQLLIEVTDNGPGIERTLFEHLLAGQMTESTKEGGSGIGMLTVRAMLQRLQGSITGETAPNKGTRWMIVLPSLEERPEAASGIAGLEAESAAPSESMVDLE